MSGASAQRNCQSRCNDARTDSDFAPRLLDWFDVHGRHDLPWQQPRSAYRVWLAEVMLQQTQVGTATPYFERFVAALPSLPALAAADLDQVLALWSGLGYYARARNLHAAARLCVDRHDGELPRGHDALLALPGIGRSTAAAIAAQAWCERRPILDGNVKRVLSRYHGVSGWPGSAAVEKRLWTLAQAHVASVRLAQARLADYTQAQMDLGATLCTRHNPDCDRCPLAQTCVAHLDNLTAQLPTSRPRKVIPQRNAQIMWLLDRDGRVLLQRRPPVGIWASLWSMPQAGDDAGTRDWLERHVRAEFGDHEPLPPVAHVFTHFKLQLQPRRWRDVALRDAVNDDHSLRWVAPAQLADLGIPAPIRKLLTTTVANPTTTRRPRTNARVATDTSKRTLRRP